jgi:phosphoglycolate phosphatase-like HAD superfamily hydrolase
LLNRSLGKLNSANRIVFDCDGVLVDSRNSYDSAIIEVLNHIFRPLMKKSPLDRTQIEKLRETGLYNNEWDAVYALTVFIFSQLSRESAQAILFWLEYDKLNQGNEEINEKSLRLQFRTFLSSLKTDPIYDVDKYAISTCNKK